MPRKRKAPTEAQALDPSRVVDLGHVRDDPYGRTWAELILPRLSPEQVVEVAQAVALAVLHVMKWPDDQAAIMAEKVKQDIAWKLQRAIDPGQASDSAPRDRPPVGDLDDDIPF